uniref:Protein kinase domain-containing protein n=1 Tax=Chlamydomonas leiostraca TaxID=1034604 RepID=A0A7S0R9G3_9CHLO|mmetsp:Transcript_16931/g.42394  ORF Transcript_16931/g.42394 Transcript_16931/m.42394 type:complete len:471 (+) Transcript_16931:1119-2531(+)
MGGDVAVKMMRRPQAGEGLTEVDVLRSFRHEASLLRRLAHPNIVALRHAQDVEPVCLVQDYAQHGTLSDYIHNTAAAAPSVNPMLGLGLGSSMSDLERAVLRRLARRVGLAPDALMADLEARSVAAHYSAAAVAADGSLPHANQRNMRRYIVLLCLLRDVAAAMTYLAGPLPGAQGGCVVHRDVKPSNILLSAAGSALLADFGVAKALPMPTAAGAGMLAPAASAPPSIAQLSSASSAEVAAVYAEWGSDMGGAMASKRTRSADAADVAAAVAGAVHMPDILPSTDFDMGWLDDLFADNGATAATAAAPVVVAQHPFQYAQHQAAQQQAAYAAASGPMLATRASTDSQQQQAEDSNWPQHHGTAHYAAPEDLARGRTPYALGPAADVFSLGTVIWEALSGQRPWVGVRAAVVADAVGVQGARLPLPGCWPARLRALVARCWAADPAQRPAAREVAAVLDEEVRCALRPGR